jgi:beta-phosphoglucomutase
MAVMDMYNWKDLQPEAVIFDFDGVIVDTEPLHYRAFQIILEPLGLGFSWAEYQETYMGFDDRDAFTEAFSSSGKSLSDEQLAGLVHEKAGIFQEVIRDGVVPYPGVKELITHLHNSHIPLAICSGALLSDILPIIDSLGIRSFFTIIVTADDVKKSKPDPESYLLAYRRLMESISIPAPSLRTIAIEDTPAGIASATGAGLPVVAVTNSYPREHLLKASYIVDSLGELLI